MAATSNGTTAPKPVRCAIYTRKSTEEGLNQEFNSLDAQREAGEAYILSQKHDGWTLVPTQYSDGGYTGANIERPGVKQCNLTPGPIAVLATFAGYHLAGFPGALVATAALMTPAVLLMLAITHQYERFRHDRRAQGLLSGLNPAITGLILSTAIVLGGGVLTSWQRWLFGAACLLILRRLHWPPVILLGIGAIAGYAGLLP
jgi:hypothetical protein